MSITLIIIIINAFVSISAFNNSNLFYKLDFSPYQVEHRKEWYRFISHAFVHAGWWHLILNMLVLFFFGDITQNYYEAYIGEKGKYYFILLYLGGVLFATIPSYRKHKDNINYHSVGASGAVSAVLFSSVIFSPATRICLYGLICLPGIIWAVVYLIYSYQEGKKAKDHIDHDAHFWGAVFGAIFTFIAVPQAFPAFLKQLNELVTF